MDKRAFLNLEVGFAAEHCCGCTSQGKPLQEQFILIFQILTELEWTLHLSHVVFFLFLYLEEVRLKYLFWFFVLNNLYSSFPPEIQT